MMTPNERAETLTGLYDVRGRLFALNEKCRATFSLSLGLNIQTALREVNEAIEEFQPEESPAPAEMEFARRKH